MNWKNLFLSAFLICTNIIAQNPNFIWAKSCGSQSNDEAYSVIHDASGNVIITGYFADTVDFDPSPATFTLASVGNDDVFIQKLNASGNLVWVKSVGGTGDDIGNSVKVDANGDVYLTGYFEGTVDFDPGAGVSNLTSNGFLDFYVLKLDATGNFVWAKQIGGVDYDSGLSLNIDLNGNVIVGGSFQNSVDFDPGASTYSLTSFGSSDAFLVKLDGLGNFVWAKQFGGTDSEVIWSVDIDATGNIYATGNFEGTADFDPSASTLNLISNGARDVFVAKVSSSGNIDWAKAFGDASSDYGQSISVDASGKVNITGSFAGTVDFDPSATSFTMTSFGGLDIFISQLDGTGNFVWAKQMGSSSNDAANGIDTDANGNIYTTGNFQDTADFDPGNGTYNLISNGGRDIYLAMLNSSGNFGWAAQIGGISSDEGSGISVDGLGNIFTVGYFRDTVDFNHEVGTLNLNSNGSSDAFIHKMNQATTNVYKFNRNNSFEVYPNPTNNFVFIQTQNLEKFSFINCFGQIIEEFTVSSKKKLDVTKLPPGIYFLRNTQSGATKKVLIE
jgi:hypothetical protein